MFGCDIDCGRRDMELSGLLRLGIILGRNTVRQPTKKIPPCRKYADKSLVSDP
jgi:hypothetical protein